MSAQYGYILGQGPPPIHNCISESQARVWREAGDVAQQLEMQLKNQTDPGSNSAATNDCLYGPEWVSLFLSIFMILWHHARTWFLEWLEGTT